MIAAIILHAPHESTADAELSIEGFANVVIRVDYPIGEGGFAELRNIGLERAREVGATWALMLDADERLIWDRSRLTLSSAIDAYDIESIDMYRSPKLIRLASGARFVGLVHEYLEGAPRRSIVGGLQFAELPKGPERIAAKIERDGRLLRQQMALEPESMRWPFYIGETERLRGNHERARHFYRKAAHLRESDGAWHREQAGWALFKAARCGWDSQLWDPVEDLTAGLVHCPWMAELPWFAAWVRMKQGRKEEALAWWCMIPLPGEGPERLGFREDNAHDDAAIARLGGEIEALS